MIQNKLTKHVRHIKSTDRYRKRMADRMSVKQAIRNGVPFGRRVALKFGGQYSDAAVAYMDVAIYRIEGEQGVFITSWSADKLPAAWMTGRTVQAVVSSHPDSWSVSDFVEVERLHELTDEGFEEFYETTLHRHSTDEIENMPF